MSEKKIITEKISTIHWDLEGSLSSAVKFLQDMLERYPDAVISYEEDRGYGTDYHLYLDNTRLETDLEFSARVKYEEAAAARLLVAKKAQLERLKKELDEE